MISKRNFDVGYHKIMEDDIRVPYVNCVLRKLNSNVIRTAVSEGNVWERGRALFSSTADGDFLFWSS